MSVEPIPAGYHSVTPYLVVDDAAGLMNFMRDAFDAVEVERIAGPDSAVMHAEMRIGDSMVMLGQARGESKARASMLHLYVSDVDAVYQKALKAGAKSIREVRDEFYGDRSGGVQDPTGNTWFIATRKENISPEELQKRASAMRAKQ